MSDQNWLDRLSHLLLREPQDREQLVNLLREAEHNQILDADALAMIEGVLQVSDLRVRDIMIPRAQMIAFTEDQTLDEMLPTVIETGHSRFPIFNGDKSSIIGILHAKDLLKYITKDAEDFVVRDTVRPTSFVPESKRLDMLLKEFRNTRNHMAMVADEYGSIAGFVTIEDVLEQIVGEIEDEFDIDEEAYIKKHSDSEYMLKALTPIEDFNEYFKSELNDEEFDTIGGLITKEFGHLPAPGETTTLDNYTVEVVRSDSRRVHLLKLTKT